MMLPVSQLGSAANYLPAGTAGALRLVIAGADPLARAGLAALIGGFEDLLVVAHVSTAERSNARVRLLAPDVIIYDADADSPPVLDGSVPTLLLVSEPGAVTAASARAAGARGVIARNSSAERIHAAVRAIGEGLLVFDEEVVHDVLRDVEEPPLAEPLTARELDVLKLLASGATNKEIAGRLGITEHTVKFHVNAILGKLSAETRTEAVVQAARRGIVSL